MRTNKHNEHSSEKGNKTVPLSLRVPEALRQQLEHEAKRERRSLTAQAVLVLERGLASDPA
jgi:hypothetical protein